jgi:serine/threonine protein kinase
LDKLGVGSYGEVFKAMAVDTGEIMAVKKIFINKQVVPSIKNEISSLKMLANHEGVIKF